MDPQPAFVGMALLTLLALLLYTCFTSRDRRIRRALRSASSTPVARLVEGEVVKVCGRARVLERVLEAPLTGRQCVFYRALVEEPGKGDGRLDSDGWHPLVDEYNSTDFLVEDATGSVRVHVDGAEPVLVLDASFWSAIFNSPTPRLEAYLAQYGQASKNWLGINRSLRYREGVLEPGEEVAVLGVVRFELAPDPGGSGGGYRARPQRPTLHAGETGLLLSDDPSVIDHEQRRFTAVSRPHRGATGRLACPRCGARTGFRSSSGAHVCLDCGASFTR